MIDKTNTPGEIVDVVDENDQIIGQSTKGEVNSNPSLIHREISVLIHDGQGRVLIQQRSHKKRIYPLYWTLSAEGHIPSGMNPQDAAHKELLEELGFDTDLRFYEKSLLKLPNETHFVYSYIGRLPKGAQITINPNETEQYKLMSQEDLELMIKNQEKIEYFTLADFRKFFAGEIKITP